MCATFVGSAPTVPVWLGEISCAALGVAAAAFDEAGHEIVDEVGELVITRPMPSMPVMFWNDPDGSRLREAYFDEYPGVWRHGDWVRVTPRGTFVIYGRSDSTLNRGGVRMGTADFYAVVEAFDERRRLPGDRHHRARARRTRARCSASWCSRPAPSSPTSSRRCATALRTELSPRHVPDRFEVVDAVPRTLNGKKCEVPVKKILAGVAPGQGRQPRRPAEPRRTGPVPARAGRGVVASGWTPSAILNTAGGREAPGGFA